MTTANYRAARAIEGQPFPHLSREDTKVWMQFLATDLVRGARAMYDVRLGGLGASLVEASHPHKGMWLTLLMKRVDVVLTWPGRTVIVEVKPHASFAALGQCLGYALLYRREHRPPGRIESVCACETCDPDLRTVFSHYGVKLWELATMGAARPKLAA